jgi:hypothetical protein
MSAVAVCCCSDPLHRDDAGGREKRMAGGGTSCGRNGGRPIYRTFAWRRSEPVHTVAARKREPNNQSHCNFQH